MPEDTVHTDADHLLSFVKERGEMAIPEIARELKLSSETLESLAELLEEEGLIQIKYKFTTPYLLPAAPHEEGAEKTESEIFVEKESAAEGSGIGEKIKIDDKADIKKAAPTKLSEAQKKAGPPPAPKPRTLEDSKPELKSISDISKAMDSLRGEGIEQEVDKLIKLANDYITKGDFEAARQVYLRIRQLKSE